MGKIQIVPQSSTTVEDESAPQDVPSNTLKIDLDFNYKTAPIQKILDLYKATRSEKDQVIYKILKARVKKSNNKRIEQMPTLPFFGPNVQPAKPNSSNPLYAHATRANTILAIIDDEKAYQTALHYDEEKMPNSDGFYDIRFLLPLLCHILDEKNICDVVKVIYKGWIYFILRGMSLEDSSIRNVAFLAYQRLLTNFQSRRSFKLHDVKIWIHFLQAVRRGICQFGECKISNLLAVWLVSSWNILKKPSHPLYHNLVSFLFAKPVIEMTIVPDFLPFFNATENKESREWMLCVLYYGLKKEADWVVAQKQPIIKFLCSAYLLEKVKVQRSIIRILTSGSKIPPIALILADRYSLPMWISNLTVTSSHLERDLKQLLKNLLLNTSETTLVAKTTLFEYVLKRKNWQLDTIEPEIESINEDPSIED